MNLPWFLVPGLLVPGAILIVAAELRGRRRLHHWHPLPGGKERLRDDLSSLLTAALICAALLLPAPETARRSLAGAAAPTVVLAVDVSTSMSAADVTPTRLDRVKAEIRQLVAALPGTTFALLPFAGEAVEQLPLTTDQQALLFFVDRLSPGMIAAPGSAPAAAALHAQQLLTAAPGPPVTASVILFSDGERTLPGPPPEVLTTIPIYCVPLGSTAGAPFLDHEGKTRRAADQRPQLSRAHPDFLEQLASRSGGKLFPLTPDSFALAALASGWHSSIAGRPANPEFFLWLALGCWLLRYLPLRGQRRGMRSTVAATALLMLVAACRLNDPCSALLASGYDAYQTGKLTAAARHYGAAAQHLDGAERAAALRDQGTVLLLNNAGQPAVDILTAALLENPQDEATRVNLALALRQSRADATEATGSGTSEPTEQNGARMSRQHALKLLKNVTPHTLPNAPLNNATMREVPLERDW
ncbi:MAG: VWA domain-containing protein [Desulfuromonadales bacterium]|nr:VWA domain-containing protein [Desulfuromonadales bacterium]MDT8423405.1 VWA domain-containing protein [Desulfuromonadales bacterium]